MRHVKGPDFPTGGIIVGRSGIVDAYRTGRGRVVVRARATSSSSSTDGTRSSSPSCPTRSTRRAGQADRRPGEGRGASPRSPTCRRDRPRRHPGGHRARRDAIPQVALNKLFKHTACQTTFGVNAIALVDSVRETLGLRTMLRHYLEHQREVVIRRTRFRLVGPRQRAHILEGLLIALANLDAVIELIRAAAEPEAAREGLMRAVRAERDPGPGDPGPAPAAPDPARGRQDPGRARRAAGADRRAARDPRRRGAGLRGGAGGAARGQGALRRRAPHRDLPRRG